MGFFEQILSKIKTGLQSSDSSQIATEEKNINETDIEKLEENLIKSDLGIKLALDFIEILRNKLEKTTIKKSEVQKELESFLLDAFKNLGEDQEEIFKLKTLDNGLTVILIVGVNGVGKTTSIGKLAAKYIKEGQKVLMAAGDTFRAAAEEQLNTWAQRANCDIVQLDEGAKSSAVVYKAIEKAKAENYNILIIDTAGRLQSKQNLMDELSKIKEVIKKNLSDAEHHCETMLVLDSSTGSNAISQAEKFNEATELNSIFLSKFDGSAKAGMVFSLAYNFKLPVKFIGTGEQVTDIQEFNLDTFLEKYFN